MISRQLTEQDADALDSLVRLALRQPDPEA
jgi:hypothetical protein